MKRLLILAALAAFAPFAAAQVCDVTYTAEVETAAGNDVSSSSLTLRGVPIADVLDNSAKALKVLDVLSKQQDKGGVYTLETGEVRSCDGKPPERIAVTSVQLKGITLHGANVGARAALQQADLIIKRYEQREKKGDVQGWDHSKSKKVKRNDVGQKLPQ
jgi:hypothetical protein